MIVTEGLKISNMSKSAGGTTDNPGRNIRAKSGLNRAILDQGWSEFMSGWACRVSLWRGCIGSLYEAGTSEHGRPSFSLRNQESSSFREERMSKLYT